jgi:hypothetical protein
MGNLKMEFKHNKKRNIGLLSEFFSRYIGEAFLDGRHNDITKAKDIWDKYMHPKSEVLKELQTFNALHQSTLQTKEIALSLFHNAKSICQNQKQSVLDTEKDLLIKEINEKLNDKSFFDKTVADYKSYASVQVLMNAWRGTGFKGNLSDMAQLEEIVLNHILKEKINSTIDASTFTNNEVDSLVVKIMTEKFNAKYSSLLNETQKKIVSLYILSQSNKENRENLTMLLQDLRENTLKVITIPAMTENFDKSLKNKLTEVISLLKNNDLNNINDETITFYMSIAKLKEEMESKV